MEEEMMDVEDTEAEIESVTNQLSTNLALQQPTSNLEVGSAALKEIASVVGSLSCTPSDTPENLEKALQCVQAVRKMISVEQNPPLQQVIESGAVPHLVKALTASSNALVFEAAWALTNIASGTSEQTAYVVQSGAVQHFVRLMCSTEDASLQEQCVWALGNIAGDSHVMRDFLLNIKELVPRLISLMSSTSKVSLLRNTTWTLSNLCRGKPAPEWSKVAPILSGFAKMIYAADDEIITDALWGISYLSDGTNERIQAVLEAGVCRRVVELMLHSSFAIQTPALRVIGNLVTGDDLQTQVAINCSCLPAFGALLSSPKRGIRKEACWALSNITAGNAQQIQAVLEAGLVPPLVKLAQTAEFDIRKEALWAIANLTSSGTGQQIHFVVQHGALAALAGVMGCADHRIILVGLEGLANIFQEGEKLSNTVGGGTNVYLEMFEALPNALEELENLQQHQSNEIYEKAVSILERFFAAEEEEDELALEGLSVVAPMQQPNPNHGFQF